METNEVQQATPETPETTIASSAPAEAEGQTPASESTQTPAQANAGGPAGGAGTQEVPAQVQPEAKGEAVKTAEAPKAETPVYDFKNIIENSEGFKFDEKAQQEFIDLIKDSGLSAEKANDIVKYGTGFVQKQINAIQQQYTQRIVDWGDKARAELGSDFDKVISTVGLAVERVEKTVPGIRQALNETGAGNRIEVIRAFELMGKLLQGDPGMAAGGATASNKNDLAKTLYPNTDFRRYL